VASKVEHKHVLRGDLAGQLCERGTDGVARGLFIAQHKHIGRLVEPRALFGEQLPLIFPFFTFSQDLCGFPHIPSCNLFTFNH